MNTRLKDWRSIIFCCVPAVTLAATVSIGIAISGASLGAFFSGPLALGMILLALLICPLHMGWMVWRIQKRHGFAKSSSLEAGCCFPGKRASTLQLYSLECLEALRTQRQALEQEVAALQETRQH